MEQNKKAQVREYPFYIKATTILLGLVLLVYILKALAGVLIPFGFATLAAILLNPLYSGLERRLPKVGALLITLLLAIAALGGFFYFLSTQIGMFLDSLPLLMRKLSTLLVEFQVWSKQHLGIAMDRQVASLKNTLHNGPDFLAGSMGTILGVVSAFVLMPIYIFLLLYYKPLILDFLFQLFQERHSLRVAEVLSQTKSAVQSYMIGLLLETAVVCVLNSLALFLIGVPYAIVIGVIGGILNLLPYIGGLIAIVLPVLTVTAIADGFSTQLVIIGAYSFIQFIDNNILVPRIVSKKVQINALVSIIAVLLGGALWGVAGMFLSIPIIGVLKIIFDRVAELKPWGRLLGDEVPSEHVGVVWQKRWNRIFRRMQQKKEMETTTDTV
ncbi:AI-2E family transporter [Paraflavisolibacter sp. H34]|uniref:AI-2E family transporter n=1 Tax=Huijunlia imazamoxiresistens TaxID=3127457 RepID=UPI003017E1BD